MVYEWNFSRNRKLCRLAQGILMRWINKVDRLKPLTISFSTLIFCYHYTLVSDQDILINSMSSSHYFLILTPHRYLTQIYVRRCELAYTIKSGCTILDEIQHTKIVSIYIFSSVTERGIDWGLQRSKLHKTTTSNLTLPMRGPSWTMKFFSSNKVKHSN